MTLTLYQLDILQEVVNIGVGRAAAVLNAMIDAHIHLQVPYIRVLCPLEVIDQLEHSLGQDPVSAVRLGFTGSIDGNAQLVFPTESASKLVSTLTEEEMDTLDLDSVKIGTLTEVGNITINGVIGSIANLLHQRFTYSLPSYVEGTVKQLLESGGESENATILLAQTQFSIETMHVEGNIILIFKVGSFDTLLATLAQEYEV